MSALNGDYEAIWSLINERTILPADNLYDKCMKWAEKHFLPLRGGLVPRRNRQQITGPRL